MRKLGLLIVALMLVLARPQAQTAPKIAWTHSGTNVTHFQVQIATNWVVDVGMPTPTGTTYEYTLPALPSGSYDVIVKACYGAVCEDSASLKVSKGVVSGAKNNNFYWVSPTGAATWANCKSDTPPAIGNNAAHCSTDDANYYVTAGDTVFLRGGVYTLAGGNNYDNGVAPYASGTLVGSTCTAPITFRAAPGETPEIVGGAAWHNGIWISGRTCINVHGLTIRDMPAWASLSNADYCELSYNTFTSTEPEATMDIGGVGLGSGSTHNWLHHNTFDRAMGTGGPCSEGNDLLRIGSGWAIGQDDPHNDYNSVENNVFSRSPHTNFDNYGAYTTIRHNISHNEPWITGCTVGQVTKEISYDTSSSSVLVGTGSKTFTVSAGKTGYVPGYPIGFVRTSDKTIAMNASITSYSGTTLVVNVVYAKGSGTYNDWIVSFGNYPEYDDTSYNGKYGHRNFQISDDYNRDGMYVLLEGNRLGHAGNNPGNGGPMNLDLTSSRNIARYNAIYNGMSAGIYFKYASADFSPPITSSTSNTIGTGTKTFTIATGLHLTAYQTIRVWVSSDHTTAMSGSVTSYNSGTGALVLSITDTRGSGTYSAWDIFWNGASGALHNRVYHNTIYHNGYGYDWRAYGFMNVAYTGVGVGQVNGANAGYTYNVITANIIYDNKEGAICQPDLYLGDGSVGQCAAETWDTTTGNYTNNPAFVAPTLTSPTSLTLPDLTLQSGSSAINGAGSLTLANGSGVASASLIVDDASFFQDGTRGSSLIRGVTLFADWIAVGTVSNVSRIISISGNTITLATPLTWANNDPVWLYKKSDGVVVLVGSAPDYGAHEYGAASPVAPAGLAVR